MSPSHTHTRNVASLYMSQFHTALEKLDYVSVWFHHWGVEKKNSPADGWEESHAALLLNVTPANFLPFSKSNDAKHGSAGARDGLKFK